MVFKHIQTLSQKEKWALGVLLVTAVLVLVVTAVSAINAVAWTGKTFPGFLVNERMVLSNVGQYHWTGSRAQLRFPDKIIEADSLPVTSMEQLLDIVGQYPAGTEVNYKIKRPDGITNVAVKTMKFSWQDLLATFGLMFVTGIFYLLIGLIVFVVKFGSQVSWAFFISCLLFGVYFVTTFDISTTHFGFVRASLVATALIPAAFLHFALFFPKTSKIVQVKPTIQGVPYLISTAIAVPMLFLYPQEQFVYFWYLALGYMIIASIGLLIPIFHEFLRPVSILARQRAKVVLFGAALAFPVPAFAYGAQMFFGSVAGVQVYGNFLALPLLFFPASIAYAIIKHNLFDVDRYIKSTVGYVIMTVVLAAAYFFIQTILSKFVIEPLFAENAQQVYPFVFALLVVTLFNPLNAKVQGAVDKLFYRKKFDYKETVLSMGTALSSILKSQGIMERIIGTLQEEMFIDKVGIVLLDKDKSGCSPFFIGDEGTEGIQESPNDMCILISDPLISLMNRERRLITKFDVEEDPHFKWTRESASKSFDEFSATLSVPLLHQDGLIGVLFIGKKKSGKFFSREDIELLQMLAHQGAVALENARLAEQMQKEEEVRSNLARYLSPQIVDNMMQDGVELNLGGQRKEVTILFSDIRNFTGISETWPPDQLVTILNEYMTEMVSIVFKHKGSIDKYVGDAIIAVFGSLIEVKNPAENAARASIEMQQAMPALNERWEKEYGVDMHMGVGVTTGEVFLGNIGSPDRMEFTVIGDAVNVASRFSGVAKAKEIIIDETSLGKLGSEFRIIEMPKVKVKGKADQMAIFKLDYDLLSD